MKFKLPGLLAHIIICVISAFLLCSELPLMWSQCWSCSGWQVWLIKLCVCLYKYMHKGVCVCERDTCGYRPKMREREVCVWMSACMLVHEWLCRAFSVGMYLQGITGPAFGCGMTPSWGPAGPSGVNRWSGCLLSQWVLSVTASC